MADSTAGDEPEHHGINPTTENLAALSWRILHPCFPDTLHGVKLPETEKNWASYRGEVLSGQRIVGSV
jgi:6-pyruvoyl-tetrahydropterin synthase